MSNLFEGSDSEQSEVEFKTDSEYAKNYDKWRKKEELNKLKTKYGEEVISEESSSESDDEELELSEKTEKGFFKILACLKSKDPRIYDKNVNFFNDEDQSKNKNKKDKPLFVKDYERKLILEKQGVLSDEEPSISTGTAKSTDLLKQNLIKSLDALNEEEDEKWEGIIKRNKSEKQFENLEEYKQWLSGKKNHLEDKNIEMELKPLKEFWSSTDLDEGEKFIRDYILHKKFLEKNEDNYIPTYDEIIHDSDQDLSNDEETIKKQDEFEHKYNFRFEEPDEEFIKRYPRTIENSLRRKEDKRKLKRLEIKERKKKEKEEKMLELKKLQELKCKEIEDKLEKLKEITGNTKVGFDDDDLEGDFDPEKYDQRMQELFNAEYYEGSEGDQKPEFPDIDEELEIESYQYFDHDEDAPHCEDENFNMDADFEPNTQQLVENSKGKKKRKRKSKFIEALNKSKPKFDPNDKTYEEYFDEYYKLDCEDFIGDIPCRFKYRKVIPNDFGLSTEEILMAKDRELNKWCSLKKAVQIRPDHVEKYDQIAFTKKAQNIALKKKILPSLFNINNDEVNTVSEKNKKEMNNLDKKMKSNKESQLHECNKETMNHNKNSSITLEEKVFIKNDTILNEINQTKKQENTKWNKEINEQISSIGEGIRQNVKGNKKRKQKNHNVTDKQKKKFKEAKPEVNPISAISDQRLTAYGIKPKKFRNKLKYKK